MKESLFWPCHSIIGLMPDLLTWSAYHLSPRLFGPLWFWAHPNHIVRSRCRRCGGEGRGEGVETGARAAQAGRVEWDSGESEGGGGVVRPSASRGRREPARRVPGSPAPNLHRTTW